MFQQVFVFDSRNPSVFLEIAREKGFRLVDIRETGSSVLGGNPAVVVWDENVGTNVLEKIPGWKSRFWPPKNTGVMVMYGEGKCNVRALPNRREFVEWFFGTEAVYWNGLTGNFRVSTKK